MNVSLRVFADEHTCASCRSCPCSLCVLSIAQCGKFGATNPYSHVRRVLGIKECSSEQLYAVLGVMEVSYLGILTILADDDDGGLACDCVYNPQSTANFGSRRRLLYSLLRM